MSDAPRKTLKKAPAARAHLNRHWPMDSTPLVEEVKRAPESLEPAVELRAADEELAERRVEAAQWAAAPADGPHGESWGEEAVERATAAG